MEIFQKVELQGGQIRLQAHETILQIQDGIGVYYLYPFCLSLGVISQILNRMESYIYRILTFTSWKKIVTLKFP